MPGVHIESAKMKKAPFTIEVAVVRPNNTTKYSPLDAIAESATSPKAIEFNCENAPQGAILTIESAELMRTGTSTDYFELWLFSKDVAATNDNEQLNINMNDNLFGTGGIIDFADERKAGNGLRYCTTLAPGFKVQIKNGSRKFYGLLRSMSGHPPLRDEIYLISLKGFVG